MVQHSDADRATDLICRTLRRRISQHGFIYFVSQVRIFIDQRATVAWMEPIILCQIIRNHIAIALSHLLVETCLTIRSSENLLLCFCFTFQFREQESSTANLGFRIEAIRVRSYLSCTFIYCLFYVPWFPAVTC